MQSSLKLQIVHRQLFIAKIAPSTETRLSQE